MSTVQMKRAWDMRAQSDAFHYVETSHWLGDVDAFFALGEQRSQLLIDPSLAKSKVNRGVALDVGCGVGRFSRALASRFENVIGVDVSGEMVKQAISHNSNFENITFRESDGNSIPIDSGTVDFVWCYEVLQHMPERDVISNTLIDVARVMKIDGFALLHFRAAQEYPTLFRNIADLLPEGFVRFAKKALGKDPLTADRAWRGVAPMKQDEIHALLASAGLTPIGWLPDPTHAPGSRQFVFCAKNAVTPSTGN